MYQEQAIEKLRDKPENVTVIFESVYCNKPINVLPHYYEHGQWGGGREEDL